MGLLCNPPVLAFIAYLLVSLVLFWPVAFGSNVVFTNSSDTYQALAYLWHVPYSLFVSHTSPYFYSGIIFPVGAALAGQSIMPLAGILSWPFQLVNRAMAFNLLFFLAFVLSGLFMFMLADYVVGNKYAAFVAGLVFAFSPMHITQAYGHLNWAMVEFLPLFVLLLLLALDKKRQVYVFGAAVSFVLLTFMGDVEQGILTLFFAIVILILYAISRDRRIVLSGRSFLVLGEMAVIILLLSAPFILSMLPYLPQAFSAVSRQSSTLYSEVWSVDLASFFLPGYYNGIFSGISSSYYVIYAPDVTERVAYIGYTVLALALLGLAYAWKHRSEEGMHHGLIWAIVALIGGVMALGPVLQVYGTVSSLPLPYLLYSYLPIFNIIREPDRFFFFATMGLAILAALGIKSLEKHPLLGTQRKRLLFVIAVSFLILVEYNGTPLSGSAAQHLVASTNVPVAYYQLGNYTSNFTTLILPALANYTSRVPEMFPGLNMYYQTALNKPILGGYAARPNASQNVSDEIIPLAASAYYLQNGGGLLYGSPIVENYSNVTKLLLRLYGTQFVSVDRQAYNLTELEQLASYLASLFGNPAYIDNTTLVFSTANALSSVGTSVAAYTPVLIGNPHAFYPISVWEPGWTFCTSSSSCNATFQDTWFGQGQAYIDVYSPKNQSVKLSMLAESPNGKKSAYVYLNGQQYTSLQLNTTLSAYTLSFPMDAGINQVVFVSAANGNNPYSGIGVMNMTFYT
jgi:hypothetical protein